MRKGFVMYYDNCRRLEQLSDARYAAAMKTFVTFTEKLSSGENAEAYLKQQLAEMAPEVAMAINFLADDARRDYEKYQETIDRRRCKQPLEKSTGRREADFRPAVDDDLLPYI